jgi:predicted NAD/FAD-binding protein
MLFDIVRFNQFAVDLLKNEEKNERFILGVGLKSSLGSKQETIGDYLRREGYSDAFRDDYLLPLTSAIWSTSPEKCSLEFPVVTVVRFM